MPTKREAVLDPLLDPKSPADVGAILEELRRLRELEVQINSECDAETAAVVNKHAARKVVNVAGREVKIADRWVELVDALEGYGSGHLAEFETDERRSSEFRHGVCGVRKEAEILAYLPQTTGQKAAKALSKHVRTSRGKPCDPAVLVQALLSDLYFGGAGKARRNLGAVVQATLAVDLAAVRNLHKAGGLSAADLELLGVEKRGGDDQFWWKLADGAPRTDAEVSAAA